MRRAIDINVPQSHFEVPGEEFCGDRYQKAEEAYLVQVVKVMRKSLGWKLVRHDDVTSLLMYFKKKGTEVFLVYDTMYGIELCTLDDTFDLQSLFDEINNHLKNDV